MKNALLLLTILLCAVSPVLAQQPYVLLDTKSDHQSPIEVIIPSPDGKYLLSGDDAGYVYFWDLKDFKVVHKLKTHTKTVNAILFNKDGSKFLTAGDDGKVKLWDYQKRTAIATFDSPYDRVNFAVLTADEKYVYFGGYRTDPYARTSYFSTLVKASVSDPSKKSYLYSNSTDYTTHGITDGIMDYSYKYVVFSAGRSVFFWNTEKDKVEFSLHSGFYINNITSLAGKFFAWADGKILRWDWDGSQYKFARAVTGGDGGGVGYSRIIFNSTETTFASGNDGNLVKLYNTENMSVSQVLSGHSDVVRAFAFVRGDSILVSGGYDGKLKLWGYPVVEEPEVDTVEVVTLPEIIEPETTKVVEKPVEVVFAENNIPVSVKDRPVDKQGSFTVNSPEVEIQVWDNSEVDGDIISLNINGEWVLENYTVSKEKTSIRITVKPNTNNYLILYAHNLGRIPPNTAAVGIIQNGKRQQLVLKSDMNKCGALNFEYKE